MAEQKGLKSQIRLKRLQNKMAALLRLSNQGEGADKEQAHSKKQMRF